MKKLTLAMLLLTKTAALPALASELRASQTVTNMSIALYMLSMSIFPLWWSAFSEQFGRRTIYLVSFALFVVFAVLSAVSTNIAMLIVFRIGTGGASASVQAVGAGTIADIWETFERGRAMSMFYLGPLLGPLLAPIIGGVLAQELGWRSCMWFLAIYGVVIVALLLFLLPETLAKRRRDEPSASASGGGVVASDNLSRVTTAESAKAGAQRLGASVKRYLLDPLKVLLLLRFPAVTITVLVAAFAFAALFIANVALQQSFSAPPYSYRQLIVGLLYIPPGLGYFAASFFGGHWMDSIMAREARKANRYDENGKLVYLPEDRMKENAWIATTVYPLSLLVYGWTLRYGIHWMAPSVFMFLFGVSSMLVFVRTQLTNPFCLSTAVGGNKRTNHPVFRAWPRRC
jgi:multidrug resistance protein